MRREEIEVELRREPFVPLRFHVVGGKKIDVPFPHVVVFQRSHVIVFKGVKEPGSRVAQGYAVFGYDQIERIEKRAARGGGRHRKAS